TPNHHPPVVSRRDQLRTVAGPGERHRGPAMCLPRNDTPGHEIVVLTKLPKVDASSRIGRGQQLSIGMQRERSHPVEVPGPTEASAGAQIPRLEKSLVRAGDQQLPGAREYRRPEALLAVEKRKLFPSHQVPDPGGMVAACRSQGISVVI